jgi:Protein of unknown function (DUF1553)
METNCTRRVVSTTASQALNLLNSDALTKLAEAFAGRVEREAPGDLTGRAVGLGLNRPITDSERSMLDAFLATQSQRHARALAGPKSEPSPEQSRRGRHLALLDLCQMLLCSNEFAYVD